MSVAMIDARELALFALAMPLAAFNQLQQIMRSVIEWQQRPSWPAIPTDTSACVSWCGVAWCATMWSGVMCCCGCGVGWCGWLDVMYVCMLPSCSTYKNKKSFLYSNLYISPAPWLPLLGARIIYLYSNNLIFFVKKNDFPIRWAPHGILPPFSSSKNSSRIVFLCSLKICHKSRPYSIVFFCGSL